LVEKASSRVATGCTVPDAATDDVTSPRITAIVAGGADLAAPPPAASATTMAATTATTTATMGTQWRARSDRSRSVPARIVMVA
jgi:hypothetical protein